MKKHILILTLAIISAFSLCGCSGELTEINSAVNQLEELGEYFESDEFKESVEELESELNTENSPEIQNEENNKFPYFTNNGVTVNLLTEKPDDIMAKMGYVKGEDYEVEETYTFETGITGLTYFVYDTLELHYTDISETEYAFSGIVVYSDGWSDFNGNLHGFTTDSTLTDLTNLYGDYYTYDSLEHSYFWDKTYDELNIYLSAMKNDNEELQNFSIFLPDTLYTEHPGILSNMSMILEK